MQYRLLGRTGIQVSTLAFGAGPVPELLTGKDQDRQLAVVEHALRQGINWFDTAASYGDGQSERSLGNTLTRLSDEYQYHLATKIRLMPKDLADIPAAVERSFVGSLQRLQVERVTLLQVHNSITVERGDSATSITSDDVLGRNGLLPQLLRLVDQGLVGHLGITGLGEASSLGRVIDSAAFATMQVPFSLLNPSAGTDVPESFGEVNYRNIIRLCAEQHMGVFAIRVYAGGAVFQQRPSRHTLKTKFFPLDLYQRDCCRAEQLSTRLSIPIPQAAIRLCAEHSSITSAIVGFSDKAHIDAAERSLSAGRLSDADRSVLEKSWER